MITSAYHWRHAPARPDLDGGNHLPSAPPQVSLNVSSNENYNFVCLFFTSIKYARSKRTYCEIVKNDYAVIIVDLTIFCLDFNLVCICAFGY